MTKLVASAGPFCAATMIMLSAGAGAVFGGERATFTPIGDLPGGTFESYAFGVSGDGHVVVGWSNIGGAIADTLRAFRWTSEAGIEMLEHLGPESDHSRAVACSFDGSVIVGLDTLWIDGNAAPLECVAIDVSADGTVLAGHCGTDVGMQAAIFTERQGWTILGALGEPIIDSFLAGVSADGSVACGQSMMDLPNVDPIRWTERDGMTSLGDVPGGAHYGLGMAISADGLTIVGDAIGDEEWDAFRWSGDDGFDVLPNAFARDVSGDGAIVVGPSEKFGAYFWQRGEPAVSLQELFETEHGLDLAGWTLVSAEGISADGLTIVGFGTNPQGDVEAWVVTLPARIITCAGDLVSSATFQPPPDGVVDAADLAFLLGEWGPNPGSPADVVTSRTFAPPPDGNVDAADLAFLLGAWGGCN